MINYGRVRGSSYPQEVEIKEKVVFTATDISEYEEIIEDQVVHGYEYNYIQYTKDEYIIMLLQQTAEFQNELLDTQAALCDIYESLENLV